MYKTFCSMIDGPTDPVYHILICSMVQEYKSKISYVYLIKPKGGQTDKINYRVDVQLSQQRKERKTPKNHEIFKK